MTNVDSGRRRNKIPPLALIVMGLLALLLVIVLVGRDGAVKSPDTGVTMPVKTEESVMPDPQPNAPVVPRPS